MIAFGETPFCSSHTQVSVAVLPDPDDDEPFGRVRDADEFVDRDDAGSLLDGERRGRERGDVGRQVARIHDAGAGRVEAGSAQQRHESAITQVLAAAVEHDLTGRDEAREHAAVVLAHLGCARPFVESALRSVGLHPTAAEQRRGDAVERRRLVQAHEPVSIEPVASGALPAVDDRHRHVGGGGERVDERHPHRPGPDDEVVDVDDRLHALIRALGRRARQGRERRALSLSRRGGRVGRVLQRVVGGSSRQQPQTNMPTATPRKTPPITSVSQCAAR